MEKPENLATNKPGIGTQPNKADAISGVQNNLQKEVSDALLHTLHLREEHILMPLDLFSKIYLELNGDPSLKPVIQRIKEQILSPFTEGNISASGYLLVDGLFPPELYPHGINPENHSSEELAPFDAANRRAYEFHTELMERQLKTFAAFSCLIGIPFRMFDAKNLIIPVTAHAAVQSSKFGGQGPNLLHKDGGFLVPRPSNNTMRPGMGPGTEISSLLCITPDRNGMGVSWIVKEDAEKVLESFSPNEQEILMSEVFYYMPAHGLNDTEGLEKFSVLYKDGFNKWKLRYSGKLAEHINSHWDANMPYKKEVVIGILQKVHDLLHAQRKEMSLKSGQILCMNQHVTFHGRSEVQDSNRMLAQLFNRFPCDGGSGLADQYKHLFQNI